MLNRPLTHARQRGAFAGAPTLSIVAPAYNERANIRPLVAAIAATMGDVPWELIVVDDDSPDGTAAEVAALAREGAPVRAIRRVGRRGLASAVVEGAMSARADIIGVIDADLQHDETLLPRMLDVLLTQDVDLVLGSRYIEGGDIGDWVASRQRMSTLATRLTGLLVGNTVSDPMSGFFMTRRAVFDAAIYDLSQQGFKILLDLLTSSPRRLKVVELPFTFRSRQAGESKVDVMILAEFAFLLIEKASRGLVPPRFVLFVAIGGAGLAVHLAVLRTALAHLSFNRAQALATLAAMGFNYLLNNSITYRAERLKGVRLLTGFVTFAIVCSVGAVANISVADMTIHEGGNWALAGIAGALMSAVFNYGVSTRFVWGRRRRTIQPVPVGAPDQGSEVTRGLSDR